jgi:hypothetical protein
MDKRKYDEYMEDDELALSLHAAAQAAADQAELFRRKYIKRIVVKQQFVGRVIGKHSENLLQLKKLSGVLLDQTTKFQGYSTVIIADDDNTKLEECVAVVENLIASCTGVATEIKSPHVIEVPENAVRFIVGPGGKVVKKIKEEFDVQIIFAPGTGKKKVVEIFGTSENVTKAKQRVRDILSGVYLPQIAEIESSESALYFKIQHEVLDAFLEGSKAKHERHILEISTADGTVLYGKRGNLLKQLRKQSLAKIFIDQSENPDKNLVVVIGPPFAVSRAIALIRERLHDPVQVLEAPSPETIQQASQSEEAAAFAKDWDEYTASLRNFS